MFETLSDKLGSIFSRLTRRGKLTEKDIDEALREVRMALLEADVNFKVAREFAAKVRERALGREVLESLTPAQQVLKIVDEALVDVLGGETVPLDLSGPSPGPVSATSSWNC